MLRQFAELEKTGKYAAAFVEAALIFEAGLHKKLDGVVVAWCLPEQQLARLMKRGMSEAEARKRIATQMPVAGKTGTGHGKNRLFRIARRNTASGGRACGRNCGSDFSHEQSLRWLICAIIVHRNRRTGRTLCHPELDTSFLRPLAVDCDLDSGRVLGRCAVGGAAADQRRRRCRATRTRGSV